MSKIILCVGLPASGKTTFSKELLAKDPNFKRINRDELRNMVDDGKWSQAREKNIKQAELALAKLYLESGNSLVIDDTNLSPQAQDMWAVFAKSNKTLLELKNFPITITEAEERDAKRPNGVGPKVIRRMWRDYICEPYEWRDGLPEVVLVDLDGTIAKMTNRGPYQEELVEDDDYIETVGNIAQMTAQLYNAKTFITSGRHITCKDATERWLKKHGFSYDEIFMRPEPTTGEKELPDNAVKENFFNEINTRYNIRAVFDDRQQVIDFYRQKGVRVFQCADGRF